MRRPSALTSMPASTMIRRPLVNSISIRRSVECSVALRDESAAGGTGPSSATTALTKPGSDFARSAAKAFRQVTSSERDRPYRRAVAATRRGSDRLSKTIRAFSSSDQRRRRPVSTTSSRFSALIVWLSIHTVLNHQAVRRKASLLGGLHRGGPALDFVVGHFVAGGAIGTMHCRVFDSLGDHKLAAGGRDQKGRHLFNKGRAAWCDEG